MKIVCVNRKALYNFQVEESYEAGIMLTGTEVKSMREGKINLQDSFCIIEKDEIFVHNMHISPYEMGNRYNKDPIRKRKLLLHREEIDRLKGLTNRRGFALVPLKVYFKHGVAKLEIALAKGRKLHDKRERIKKRDRERALQRGEHIL